MKDMQGLFIHFTHSEYIYDGSTSDLIWSKMNDAEKDTFKFNVRLVDWVKCLNGF
jgi:hypothetical protein